MQFEDVIERKLKDAGIYIDKGAMVFILKTIEIQSLRERALNPHHPLPTHVSRWVMSGAKPAAGFDQLRLPDEFLFREKAS